MTPSGIEPATIQLVAQCLNKLRSVTGFASCPTLYIKFGTLNKFHISSVVTVLNFASYIGKVGPVAQSV